MAYIWNFCCLWYVNFIKIFGKLLFSVSSHFYTISYINHINIKWLVGRFRTFQPSTARNSIFSVIQPLTPCFDKNNLCNTCVVFAVDLVPWSNKDLVVIWLLCTAPLSNNNSNSSWIEFKDPALFAQTTNSKVIISRDAIFQHSCRFRQLSTWPWNILIHGICYTSICSYVSRLRFVPLNPIIRYVAGYKSMLGLHCTDGAFVLVQVNWN